MKIWLLLISVVALAGCATTSEETTSLAEDPGERICVGVHSINSFDALDDRHVYIKATGNKHYLFTLYGGCYDLRSAHTIAVKDTFSRVCSNSYGEIVHRGLGRRLETCRIQNVERIESKDDARGLVEDREKARKEAWKAKKESKE